MYKEMIIETIRIHWFFPEGSLEKMTLEEVEAIYDDLVRWLEN